jgi:hypothetical protein
VTELGARLDALRESDPDQFRKLMLGLNKITLKPHSGQSEVIASGARFRVLDCGRRWGKTKLAAHILTKKSRKPNQMLWWVAPTYKVVKRGYAEVLTQLPDGVLTHAPPPDTNFDAGRSVILRFKNGTRMEFYSAERPEGMLGAGVDFAVLDEAAIMPMRIWNQIVRPTLMDRQGGAIMISTPRGRNWFYTVWKQGQDPAQPTFASWTFPSWTNPTLPEGEVEAMKASMPRMEYEQEVEAKFLAAGSSTFFYDERCMQHDQILENGMIEDSPPKGYVVLGIDLARTNDYTVLYGSNMDNRRNCYFERMQAVTWPEQKRRIRRAERQLRREGAESVLMMIDSTGVGDPVKEDLEADGYDVVGLNFTTHKANMVRLLAKDLEEAQAFILADAQVSEFENYTMSITPSGKMTYSAPEGEHDDVVCAKMLSHWGCINEGVGAVSVISSGSPLAENDPRTPSDPTKATQNRCPGCHEADRASRGAVPRGWPEDKQIPCRDEWHDADPNETSQDRVASGDSNDLDVALYADGSDEDGPGWDDLIDTELTDAEAAEAIGLGPVGRVLTPQELLLHPEAWR